MDYSGSPRAPGGGGRAFPIHALSAALGEDVLDHPEEHGFGECDAETMEQLRRVRGAPGAKVRIYRALPPRVGQINRGDWVTLSKDYAGQYAMRDDVAANDWPIVQAEVPACTVFSDGRDLDGYGYDGPSLAGLRDQGGAGGGAAAGAGTPWEEDQE
ncbi:hypothetical protein [Sinomonas terrae]|uniref:Uncharacterized protein n=1 Tax=Sinomonas terrae TaxID=2908838 RepID=A0ABS9U879_9MICC|nr:hypothetical protein [Sinomonas terrae]MCH6472572.1 hypothetical protein [Sinomonas terrae]